MAFSDYKTMAQAQIEFNITYHEENFIAASAVAPPQPFVEELAFNRTHMDVFSSEGARAEMIIFPILREAYKSYYDQYELWVQKALATVKVTVTLNLQHMTHRAKQNGGG